MTETEALELKTQIELKADELYQLLFAYNNYAFEDLNNEFDRSEAMDFVVRMKVGKCLTAFNYELIAMLLKD